MSGVTEEIAELLAAVSKWRKMALRQRDRAERLLKASRHLGEENEKLKREARLMRATVETTYRLTEGVMDLVKESS